MNKKYGFTIAEILIAVGLIGILAYLLASITQVNSSAAWQKSKDYKLGLVKYDKVYNAINYSFISQLMKDSTVFYRDKNAVLNNAISSLNAECTGNNCKFTGYAGTSNNLRVGMADGSEISIKTFPDSNGKSPDNSISDLAYIIYVDTNGSKTAPNVLNQDILSIYVNSQGDVINVNPKTGKLPMQNQQKKYAGKAFNVKCPDNISEMRVVKNNKTGVYELANGSKSCFEQMHHCTQDYAKKVFAYKINSQYNTSVNWNNVTLQNTKLTYNVYSADYNFTQCQLGEIKKIPCMFYDESKAAESICAVELFSILADNASLKNTSATQLLRISDRGSNASGRNSSYTISRTKMASAYSKYPANTKIGKFIRKFYNGTNSTKTYNDLAYIGHAWGTDSNNYLDFGEWYDGILGGKLGKDTNRRNYVEGETYDFAITLSLFPDEQCNNYDLYDPNETICAMQLYSILADYPSFANNEIKDLLYISDVGSNARGGDSIYTVSKTKLQSAFNKYGADTKEGKFIRKFYNGSSTTKLFNDIAYIGHAWGSNSNNYMDFGEFVDDIIQGKMGVSISRRAGNSASYEGMVKDTAITLSSLPSEENAAISAVRLFSILADDSSLASMTMGELTYISDFGSGSRGADSKYTVSRAELQRAYNKYSADSTEGKFIRMFYNGSSATQLFNDIAYIGHAWGTASNDYMDFGEYVGGLEIPVNRSVYDLSSYNSIPNDYEIKLSTLQNR